MFPLKARTIVVGIAGASLVVMLSFLSTAAAGLSLVDQAGRTITVDKPFSRIISLYGAHTENLRFLGLDREIIGVARSDSHDKRFSSKPWFSYHDDPEKFLGARPDLVLVRPMIELGYPGLIKRLERSGITVASLQPATVEEMYDYWIALGTLSGRETRAAKMVADFQRQVAFYRSLTQGVTSKKRVYFEAIHSRMKTFTPGSMALFALEAAGGINVAGDASSSRGTNIGNYGKERILSHGKEIDVFLAQQGVMNQVSLGMIKDEPGFGIIKAVRNNQVYLIDEMIVSRPGFRLLQGIRTIGEILYPELFGNLAE
ncbi:MAG: ABC transporter substrate-binding protein [Desulfobacterium sp.]|nr:ABC transporter substrate-binding protein [Desulfobacterium sp.]